MDARNLTSSEMVGNLQKSNSESCNAFDKTSYTGEMMDQGEQDLENKI